MKKAGTLRDMTEEELLREQAELRQSLFKLRLSQSIGQLEKPHKIRSTRRELAQVLTILRERELKAKESR